MLIRTYGLFWKRDDVFWGRQKNSGHLLGIHSEKKKGHPINFRDQVGFYGLYNHNFDLVYFGQAGRGKGQTLFGRLRQHTSDHLAERWSRFSWFGVKYVKNDNSLSIGKGNIQGEQAKFLDQVEAIVIAVCEPPNNLQGGRFGKAEKYLQYRDEEKLGPSTEKMIEKLFGSLPKD